MFNGSMVETGFQFLYHLFIHHIAPRVHHIVPFCWNKKR